jgi:DNA-binding phage protein
MESKSHHRVVHVCCCSDCQAGRQREIVKEHQAINQLIALLDEKRRRLFAGFWATVYSRGGIARLAVITGLSRTTIRRGRSEFLQPESIDTSRIRRSGGGRKRLEKKCPDLTNVLDQLLQDVTAGDPMTGLKWTHKSTRKLCAILRRRGITVSRKTIASSSPVRVNIR